MKLYSDSDFNEAKQKDLLKIKCDYCNNEFKRNKKAIITAVRYNKQHGIEYDCIRYCSRECKDKSRNTQIRCECNYCKKEIYKEKHSFDRSEKHYCSRECSDLDSNNKNKNSIKIKNLLETSVHYEYLYNIGIKRISEKNLKKLERIIESGIKISYEKLENKKTKVICGYVTCKNCGHEFIKPVNGINTENTFCSTFCNSHYYLNLGKSENEIKFSIYINRIKRRGRIVKNRKIIDCDIDCDYLGEIWESQKGICPYTGIKMELETRSKISDQNVAASVDRIDSSIGYVKGNIEFIVRSINLLKNTMSKEKTIEICKIISNRWKE